MIEGDGTTSISANEGATRLLQTIPLQHTGISDCHFWKEIGTNRKLGGIFGREKDVLGKINKSLENKKVFILKRCLPDSKLFHGQRAGG
jgi:hypothetical protein